jgi:hypothetical protein
VPQVFSRRDTLLIKLLLLAALCVAAALVFAARWRMSGVQDVSAMPMQPIPFSHKHHAGDDRIDCRYCHSAVEKAAFAGMPSTKVCLTCHSQLFKDAGPLQPLHESARTGEPIAWRRVYDLPGFVYFNHGIHVAKGVGCIECHGRIDEMPLTRLVAPLTMAWCLECHRNPGPRLRAPQYEFAMVPTAALHADPNELVRFYRLESTRRLTDCSRCHR